MLDTQGVTGSSPVAPTIYNFCIGVIPRSCTSVAEKTRFVQSNSTVRETLHRIGKLLYFYRDEASENHTVDLVVAYQPAGVRHNVCGNAGAGHHHPCWHTRNAGRLSYRRIYRQRWRAFEPRFILLPNVLSMQCYQWLCDADDYVQLDFCWP